jgi:hypothetical protein
MMVALAGSLLSPLHTITNAQIKDSSLYKFVLDYAVPESPAFAILGVTPEKILRGSAAKPVVGSLLTQVQTGGKLKSGVAIDLAPYFVYGGTIRSIKEYAENPWTRILANTQLSMATMQSPTDTTSMGGSIAVRMNILDAGDPLRDLAALKPLFDALNQCASAPSPKEINEGDTRERCATVAEAFAKVKEAALKRPGFLLAVGGGLGGRLRGSVADVDSLTDRIGRWWVSAGYRTARSNELQVLAQLVDTTGQRLSFRGGAAARAQFPTTQFALELVYDGIAHQWQPGGTAEWRLISGAWLVTSLGVQSDATSTTTVPKLRLRTALRWNPVAAGH